MTLNDTFFLTDSDPSDAFVPVSHLQVHSFVLQLDDMAWIDETNIFFFIGDHVSHYLHHGLICWHSMNSDIALKGDLAFSM